MDHRRGGSGDSNSRNGKYRCSWCRYCEPRSSVRGSCVVNNCWCGSRDELLNMHGCCSGERWSGESVAEAETSSEGRYRSSEGSTAVGNSGSCVVDNSRCWGSYCNAWCSEHWRSLLNNSGCWSSYRISRSGERRGCVMDNSLLWGRQELPNMHGCRSGQSRSSKCVTESEASSECCQRGGNSGGAVSDSRCGVLQYSGSGKGKWTESWRGGSRNTKSWRGMMNDCRSGECVTET